MPSTTTYYDDEMRYLYESGRRFAAAHPDRARFLNIDAVGDRDPTVERLFEGFAFLTARIRQKIDELFPEMTETLVERLWPQLLHDIPSAAIVQLAPRRGLLQQSRTLPRGLEVLSSQTGPEHVRCRFVTTAAVRLSPVSLARVTAETDTRGHQSLSLTFRFDNGINRESIALDPLRLYIHAELASALTVYELLTTRVVAAHVTVPDGRRVCDIAPNRATSPAGLTPEESLLPQRASGAWGYSLLAEYFAYPEKFMFVDLCGLDTVCRDETLPSELTLTFTLDRPFPPGFTPTTDTFRLFCTPAVNLYARDAEPIRVNGRADGHRVVADSARPKTVVAHSIVSVTGVDRATGERTDYAPAATASLRPGERRDLYSVRHSRAPDGHRELTLSFGGKRLREGAIREENMSVGVLCTNGALPREELGEGDIDKPGAGIPDYVSVRNITRPSLPSAPPERTDLHWAFLAHLNAGYASIASADTLRSLLESYDWAKTPVNRRRIESIIDVSVAPFTRVSGGAFVQGMHYVVTVNEEQIGGSAELSLFGQILREFLAHYLSLNTVLELQFVLSPSGTTVPVRPAGGKKCLV